jgi:hypothetical protein
MFSVCLFYLLFPFCFCLFQKSSRANEDSVGALNVTVTGCIVENVTFDSMTSAKLINFDSSNYLPASSLLINNCGIRNVTGGSNACVGIVGQLASAGVNR